MIKYVLSILMLCALSLTSLHANGDFFMVSSVGSSAEMISKGNIEGISDYSNNVFDNPAALKRINKFSATLFTTTLMEEIAYRNISMAFRLPVGVMGIGYMSADVEDIIRSKRVVFDEENNPEDYEFLPDGTFGYTNNIMKLSYQISQTKNLHWGVSAVRYYTKIDDIDGEGFNVDGGALLEMYPLTLSFVARNVMSSSKVTYSNDGEENLPLQGVISGLYRMREFDIYAQIKTSGSTINEDFNKAFGITYYPELFSMVEFSAGYKEFPVLREVQNNITLGLGLTLYDLKFNYAYESSDHPLYNGKHYFSLGLAY